MNLRASYGFGASVCANLLSMWTTMPDKENDSSPGEMGPCVQSPADDLIDDRAVDLLAQFDEVLLKGTLILMIHLLIQYDWQPCLANWDA